MTSDSEHERELDDFHKGMEGMEEESKVKHDYPSGYEPGQGIWEVDKSWEIMDTLQPGAISAFARALLGGMIMGALLTARSRALNEAAAQSTPRSETGSVKNESKRGPEYGCDSAGWPDVVGESDRG